jgi:hypothetical protein
MMNVKETLKRLHRRLPTLSLDELFELLDCYVEQSTLTGFPNWELNKVWYSTDKTTSVNEVPKINSITSKNADPAIYTVNSNCTDGKIKFYDGGGSTQLVANH